MGSYNCYGSGSSTSMMSSQQQQRFSYSINNVNKNKASKVSDNGGIEYRDHQGYCQQQQHYRCVNHIGASYYGCAGFLTKQLQHSTVSCGGNGDRINCTFPRKVV